MTDRQLIRFRSSIWIGSGCWPWLGAMDMDGYGRFNMNRKLRPAHRVAYELAKGWIPDGLEIDHICRNKNCVRPDHLEAVTRRENMRRRYAPMTHCVNGHPFDEENTYWRTTGYRDCRACGRVRVRNYLTRKAAA